MNATEVLEDILQKLDSPEGREFAQTFSSPILAWGAGMAVGVAKAIEEMQPILDAKQAEIDALKAQRDVAIKHIAEWCAAIQQNGSSWDDWDEYYKKACCRDNALPEIRELLDAAIKKARSDELGVQS